MDQIKKLQRLAGIKQDKVALDESMHDRINVRRNIDVPMLDASDWELYGDSEGSDVVAQVLSEKFAEAVNAGLSPSEVENVMHKVMIPFSSKYGTLDTEPRQVLRALLRRVYGRDYEE